MLSFAQFKAEWRSVPLERMRSSCGICRQRRKGHIFRKKYDFFISALFILFYANIDYSVIIVRFNVKVRHFVRLVANVSVYILRF